MHSRNHLVIRPCLMEKPHVSKQSTLAPKSLLSLLFGNRDTCLNITVTDGQVVVYLSKINGFAFPARNYCLWNFKNLQNIQKKNEKHCLKKHETTCNGFVYLSACRNSQSPRSFRYDHSLLHISLKNSPLPSLKLSCHEGFWAFGGVVTPYILDTQMYE